MRDTRRKILSEDEKTGTSRHTTDLFAPIPQKPILGHRCIIAESTNISLLLVAAFFSFISSSFLAIGLTFGARFCTIVLSSVTYRLLWPIAP